MLACTRRVVGSVAGVVLLLILVGVSGWCVEVDILSTSKQGAPGSFVTHVFAIINDSPNPETYSLEFIAPAGWGILGAPASIALQPNEEGTLFVTATIPPGAAAGEYYLKLTATSQSDPSDSASASGIVIVMPMNEIELLAPTGGGVAPGESITYEFVLINRGNVQDSFVLTAMSSRELVITMSHTAIDLAPQERLTFTVQLAAAVGVVPSRDVLTVAAESVIFDGVVADAVVFTSVLPPAPHAVAGILMEALPARIRLSIDKNVMTGAFASRMTFSTSGQIKGGFFSSFFSLLNPFGPSQAGISSFSILYRRSPTTFSIGNVSQRLTELIRLSCVGGSVEIDADYYNFSIIGGGRNDQTRFAGHLALGPDTVNLGIGYMGIRDAERSQAIWTATAHAEPLADWRMTLEGSLGLDGPLTSRAVFFNTTIDSTGYFFSGSAFSVGTHFPGQRADSAGIEVSQRLRLDELSLSASLSHLWDNVNRDPLKQTLIRDDLGFNLNTTPFENGPTLAATIDFSWDRYPDLSQKSDLTRLLAVRMTETDGVFPYLLTGRMVEQIDHVHDSHVRTTTYSQGAGLAIDQFHLFLQLTQKRSMDMVTDTQLSSSSDLSIRFRPQAALHEASITFRSSRDTFDLSGSFFINFVDDLDIIFDGSISWDRYDANAVRFGWGVAFNATISIPLPFLVTKGRIEGRAFVDHDGDGVYGLNDEPVGSIVIEAEHSQVSTNNDGYFRFPPFYPGTYTISPGRLPIQAAAGEPISVTLIAGDTIWVDVPLLPVTVVSGDVFEDNDKDGVRDPDEGGFAQVRVVMQSDIDGDIFDAYTDLSGAFAVVDILPGTYSVFVDADSLPTRFEFTTAEQVTVVIGAEQPLPISFGGFIRAREVIITFQPPTADFFFQPEEPVAGMPVSFDGTYSFDFDGVIMSYAWDFDGDGIIDSTDSIVQYTFQQPGTFDVALTVVDDAGNEDTVIHPVTVSGEEQIAPVALLQPPVASFSYMPAQPQTGETILFDGTASSDFDGVIITYAWDFDGDGQVDAGESIASHIFLIPGTYHVSLTVTDDGGQHDTVTHPVVVAGMPQEPVTPPAVTQIPIADFAISPPDPQPGDLIAFNGTISIDLDGFIEAFAWDFDGDGVIDSTAPIAEYTFVAAGLYDVTLTVTDGDGNSDRVTIAIQVGAAPTPVVGVIPPVADFEFMPTQPAPGAMVLFNGTLSTDADGQVVSYQWDFDGDGQTDSTAAIVDHTFMADGLYDVSLTVTDDAGNMDTLTLQVVVGTGEALPPPAAAMPPPAAAMPPVADFEYSPAQPAAGELVLLNSMLSTDSDGVIVAYAWDFNGDDIIDSTDAFTEHMFPSAGTFNVSLTVTDDTGNSDTFIQTITVAPELAQPVPPPATFQPPVADFTFMPAQPMAGGLVLFNATTSSDFDGHIVAFAWDFNNDGTPDANTAFAEHFFPSPGTITVSLTVTDDSGASDTLSIPIEVK